MASEGAGLWSLAVKSTGFGDGHPLVFTLTRGLLTLSAWEVTNLCPYQ